MRFRLNTGRFLASAVGSLLTALFALQASAQSSVQVYGIIDTGVQYAKTGAPGVKWEKSVTSGNQWASRLGFLGREDLGDGLSAFFNIETGIANDTGTTITYGEPATAFWARRAVVGLKNQYGEILLGRDYTPGFWTIIQLDRNLYGLPGTISAASQLRDARANNGIYYNSPSVGGFIVRTAAAAGEGVTGRLLAGSVDYRNQGFFASASLQRRNTLAAGVTPAGHANEGGLGAEYKFSNYVANAGYWQTEPVTVATGSLEKTKAFWVGGAVTFGLHVVYAQVARIQFDFLGADQGKATNFGVSYNYFLSKRTNLYASYGGVNNDAHASQALSTGSVRVGGAAAGAGADPRALLIGVKHSF